MDRSSSNPSMIAPFNRDGPQGAVAAYRQPWQFSLRGVLVLTALVGCVMLLVLLKGWGVLAVVVGLTVTWLNFRGSFAAWQGRESLHRPIRTGWLLLGLSLLLPSVRACGNSNLAGWETAEACALMQFTADSEAVKKNVGQYVLFTLMNVANLFLLASPLWEWQLRRGRGQACMALFGCAATAAWTAAVPNPNGFLVGYYVWCLAQLCILSAARPGARTLIAMSVMAAVRLFLWPAEGNLSDVTVGPTPATMLRTIPVSGTVTLDGAPVEGATVTFNPIGPEPTRVAGAITDAQGQFLLRTSIGGSALAEGAVPGEYAIIVSNSKQVEAWEQKIPDSYGRFPSSPLRYTVAAGKLNVVKLDLSSSDRQ
jgi:hypothetical protein